MSRWSSFVTVLSLLVSVLVACIATMPPVSADEVMSEMEHFEVTVDHVEITSASSYTVKLIWDHPASGYSVFYQGPNGTLVRYAEGATIDVSVAVIPALSSGTYQFIVQALNGTSIVAVGVLNLEILNIYSNSSYGSSGSTANGSIINSMNYTMAGSDLSKITGYTVYRSVNGSDFLPYLWLSEPAFEVVEPGGEGSMYLYSVYANASGVQYYIGTTGGGITKDPEPPAWAPILPVIAFIGIIGFAFIYDRW